MSELQNIVLIITAIASVMGLSLGVFNFVINVKNRRNSLRDRVNEKQFEFFLKFNEYTATIDNYLTDFNQKYANNEQLIKLLDERINEFDLFVAKNELIIPEVLYKQVFSYVTLLYNTTTPTFKDHSFLDEKKKIELMDADIDLQLDIIDFLGLEKLSRENMKLARGMK